MAWACPLSLLPAPLPRRIELARPQTRPLGPGCLLFIGVGAAAVPLVVERPSLPHQLGADIGTVDAADCDRTPIAIHVPSLARQLPTISQAPKRFGGIVAASPWPTIAAADLRTLDRVDAPKPDSIAIREFKGVPVHDPGPDSQRPSGSNHT